MKKLYLSPEFNSRSEKGKMDVKQFISNQFDANGSGGIVAMGSSSSNQIVFQCFCYRKSMSGASTNGEISRKTSTSRPNSTNDVGKWRFTLYIEPHPTVKDPHACRYYFYDNGSGNHFHNGHFKKKVDEVTKRTELVDKDKLEITVDDQKGNLSSQSMAMLLYQRTGLALKSRNIQKNYKTKTQQGKMLSTKASAQPSRMSPAKKVISNLSSRKDISVVYLVAKVELSKDLVMTYTKPQRKRRVQAREGASHYV
jgi:hypothetical protein